MYTGAGYIAGETSAYCPGDCPVADPDICTGTVSTCGTGCIADVQPIDVFFVLDTSSSMRGSLGSTSRLSTMKAAVKNILNMMETGDRASIVSFNNDAIINLNLTGSLLTAKAVASNLTAPAV